MSLFMLEIAVIPGVYCDDFGKLPARIQDLINKSIKKENALKFKVIGENKFVALAESEEIAEKVGGAVSEGAGPYVTIKSTPVRNYEEFSNNILKVDPDICISRRDAFMTTKKIFYTKVTIGHPGAKLEDLLPIWKSEAEQGLAKRVKGEADFRAFKVIAQRAVYLFWALDSAGEMDDAVQSVPLAVSRISGNDFHFNDIAQVNPF